MLPAAGWPTEVPEAVRVKLVPLIDEFRNSGTRRRGDRQDGPCVRIVNLKTAPCPASDSTQMRPP
jgi:hypothetical protein